MKHFLLTLAIFWSSIVCAQPNSIFGLKFGDKVSKQDIIAAVGNNGHYINSSIDSSDETKETHLFSNVSLNGECYSAVSICTYSDGTLFNYSVVYMVDETHSQELLNDIYFSKFEELCLQYPDMSESKLERDDMIAFFHQNKEMPEVSMFKRVSNGRIITVGISYFDVDLMLEHKNESKPKLQDKFFNLVLGKIATGSDIKSKVGMSGELIRTEHQGGKSVYIFVDINFAGRVWDFGEITTDKNDVLFMVKVYNSHPDGILDYDEKADAEKAYADIVTRLNNKYGPGKETRVDDDYYYTNYYGNNDIAASVSIERSKSSGGEYRRYFSLEYVFLPIMRDVDREEDDEL